MSNKIKLQADFGDEFYQPSSSEDDYSEDEKRLLQKFRKRNQRKTEPRQEIMNFKPDESDDDDDGDDGDDFGNFEANSDMEDADAHDDIPDARAWGKKRRDFYSTDFDGETYGKYSAREEELAEQEEAEAKALQLRLAKNLEEADFSLNTFVTDLEKTKKSKKEKAVEIHLKKDLSELTERQKEQLFQKESPEFSNLVKDMTERLTESSELLEPVLEFLDSKASPLVDFVKLRHYINLNYATNVGFYLVLKSKRLPIKNHPVIKRLVQLRQLLLQLEDKYVQTIKPQIDEILESISEGKAISFKTVESSDIRTTADKLKGKLRKKLGVLKSFEAEAEEDVEMEDTGDQPLPDELESDEEGDEGNEGEGDEGEDENADENDEAGEERRAITYQIAKNKGLTPYRKKELRNPRVKHRNKFRKALIRRKGAHRTVRKEIKRYDGEKFGIKTTVKKGIKIK